MKAVCCIAVYNFQFLFWRTRIRDRSRERIDPYNFVSDDELKYKTRQDADNYGAELARQVRDWTITEYCTVGLDRYVIGW